MRLPNFSLNTLLQPHGVSIGPYPHWSFALHLRLTTIHVRHYRIDRYYTAAMSGTIFCHCVAQVQTCSMYQLDLQSTLHLHVLLYFRTTIGLLNAPRRQGRPQEYMATMAMTIALFGVLWP